MAYDALKERAPSIAAAEYLAILHLAALEGESIVDEALRWLLDRDQAPASEAVAGFVREGRRIPPVTDVTVAAVDLAEYDRLLTRKEDEDFDSGEHERAVERLPQGVVPADDARQLRGAGPPCAAGVAQL
jgi:hypothetical protein